MSAAGYDSTACCVRSRNLKPRTKVFFGNSTVHTLESGRPSRSSRRAGPTKSCPPTLTGGWPPKYNSNRLCASVAGQSIKSGKFSSCGSRSGSRRGETSKETRSDRPSSLYPLGSAVQRVDCLAISGGLRRKCLAVFGPGQLIGNEFDEFRIALRTAELAAAHHRHAEAQKQHVDFDFKRRLAPDDRLPALFQIGELEIECQRRRNEPQDRKLAVQPNISGQFHRRRLPVEIDACLDLHAAAGDTEVDRKRRAEFERRLDLPHAFGADTDGKKAAAAQQRYREAEWPLPFGEIETHFRGLGVDRKQKPCPKREMLEGKNADAQRGNIDRITCSDPAWRD